MSRPVLISETADRDLRQACQWWAEHRSSADAERWFDGFIGRLLNLSADAERYALASEAHAFTTEVRQLNFGLGDIVREERVLILRIRHLS